MSSFQNVYFNNPSTIQDLQTVTQGLKWNTVTDQNWTAKSNTNYIWNLADTRNIAIGAAVVTFPASPADGDFIEIVDGLGTWGNCLYTNVGLNMNGKLLSGMTATGTVTSTTCAGGFRDYRKGSILFTYRSVNNTWYANGTVGRSMTTEYSEVANETEDPWMGWWMFYTPIAVTTLVNGKANTVGTTTTFPVLNSGARSSCFSYLYFDTSTYPFTSIWYTGDFSESNVGGAWSTRSYEYYTTGSVVDKTQLVSAYSQVGSLPLPPWQAASSSTNAQGAGFRLQRNNNSIATVSLGNVVPDFQTPNQTSYSMIVKLKSAPGYSQKSKTESSMYGFFNESDIGDGVNFNDQTENFKKMCLESIYQSNPQSQQIGGSAVGRFVYEKDPYFIGNTGPNGFNAGGIQAIEVMNEFLSETGKTFTTPIFNIVKSYSGPATVNGVPNKISIGSTEVTTIFTKGTSYCTPGSNVTISGLTGSWARMNGYYPNGVSLWENISRKDIDPVQMDCVMNATTYTGTIANSYNRFNLIYDSWSGAFEAETSGAYLNYAKNFGQATVSVTHRVYPTMGYNELFAAITAFQNYVFGPATHTRTGIQYFDTYRTNIVGRLASNWHLLGTPATTGQGANDFFACRPQEVNCVSFSLYGRRGNNNYSWYMRNDPYNVGSSIYTAYFATGANSENLYSKFVPSNYLVTGTVGKLRWGVDGPLYKNEIYNTGYYQSIGATYQLNNLTFNSLTGGSTVVGKVFNIYNGITGAGSPYGDTPNWNYWNGAFGSGRNTSLENFERSKYGLICGLIRPEYTIFTGYPGWSGPTGPKRVGFFYQNYMTVDSRFNLTSAMAPPVDPSNPTGPYNPRLATGTDKPYSAALRNIWASMMTYLLAPTGAGGLACDTIIIDNRANLGGGGTEGEELATFFGGDRNGTKTFARKGDDGFSGLIDPDSLSFALDAQSIMNAKSTRITTSDNAINYPNAMYRGVGTSYTGARKLVILNSDQAKSNGARAVRWYAGDNFDGKIGNNTVVKMLGSADTKFQGSTTTIASQEGIGDQGNSYMNVYPYMQLNVEIPAYNLTCQYVTTGSTGTLWAHKDYPIFGPSVPKNGFRGTCGTGAALPSDLQSYLYPAVGAYPGAFAAQQAQFPNLYLPGKTEIPTITNADTWRDPWLETAIYEAMVPVLPGEN